MIDIRLTNAWFTCGSLQLSLHSAQGLAAPDGEQNRVEVLEDQSRCLDSWHIVKECERSK
jgi:hypothetical protein